MLEKAFNVAVDQARDGDPKRDRMRGLGAQKRSTHGNRYSGEEGGER